MRGHTAIPMHSVDDDGSDTTLFVSHGDIPPTPFDDCEMEVLDEAAMAKYQRFIAWPYPIRRLLRAHYSTSPRQKGMVAVAFLSAAALLVMVLSHGMALPLLLPSLPANSNSTGGVCLTPECVLTAARVVGKMDMTVDPCHDFYQFACGNWIRSTPIPEHKSRYGAFDLLDESQQVLLRQVLEHSEPKDELFKRLQSFHRACTDESRIEQQGLKPLASLIHEVSKHFPSRFTERMTRTEMASALSFLHLLRIPVLFATDVEIDAKHPDRYAVHISQDGLGLPNRDYYQKETMVAKYRDIVAETLKMVLLADASTWLSYDPDLTQARIEEVARDIVAFEIKVAGISLPEEDLNDPAKTYNPTNVTALHSSVDIIDWKSYFSKVLPNVNNIEKLTIINVSPAYFAKLKDLAYDVSPATLQYYFIWHTILKHLSHIDPKHQGPWRQMKQLISGTDQMPPRWKTCVALSSEVMGLVLGRAFVERSFTENSRMSADEMISRVRGAFRTRLGELEWLDADTLVKANEKVGFPEYMKNDSVLMERYGGLAASNDYFANILQAERFKTAQDLNRLHESVDRREWHMDPQTVNAYYSPSMNEIVFPAAILQSPFFDANAPGSLNYGAIGSIVGHEITHGFDNHGRLFDGRGILVSWWSNRSAEAFDNKAKCFVNQYNDYEVSKGNHVNGQLTLGENLADNGGLYVAWKAWQRGRSDPNTRLKEFKLPGLLEWTPEQMFFVSYAQNWCANVRPEEALRRLMVDPHAPNEFRVQGPLVNSREFATAYKCPLGSPMNPQQKCQVW